MNQLHLRLLAPLAAVLVAGCAFSLSTLPAGELLLRPVTSAKVSFHVPSRLPVHVERWGNIKPTITDKDLAHSRQATKVLVDEVRKQVPAAIESMLRSRGIPAGDQAHVRLSVDQISDDGVRASIQLTMQVFYQGDPAGTTPWSVKITGNTAVGTDAQTAAGRIAANAADQLVHYGLVASSSR